MDYPKYDLGTSSDSTIFEFTSTGTHGDIPKAIKYTLTQNTNIYNLGFGDKINIDVHNGKFDIDDTSVTDNGDRDVVLATIAEATYAFTSMYPNKYVFFAGSCDRRTRLYRMAISNNFVELSETFIIFGVIIDGETGNYKDVPFNGNTNFVGFLIKRR